MNSVQTKNEDHPFFRAQKVSYTRMKQLVGWTKKYRHYNAYAVVDEYPNKKYREGVPSWTISLYDVDLYCDKIKG